LLGGVIAWFLIANVGNYVLRVTWPGYSEVAKTFTLGMLIARLFVGAISSLCTGFVAAWVTKRSMLAIKSPAGLLLVLFLPVVTLLGGLLYPAAGDDAIKESAARPDLRMSESERVI
jgi:hypothetical protein